MFARILAQLVPYPSSAQPGASSSHGLAWKAMPCPLPSSAVGIEWAGLILSGTVADRSTSPGEDLPYLICPLVLRCVGAELLVCRIPTPVVRKSEVGG